MKRRDSTVASKAVKTPARGAAELLTISVTVKPHARTDRVTQIDARSYDVSVRAAPHDGKANEAVIELLAGHFSVAKSTVKIARGYTARKKIITIG
jgi:uncharacterized protein